MQSITIIETCVILNPVSEGRDWMDEYIQNVDKYISDNVNKKGDLNDNLINYFTNF